MLRSPLLSRGAFTIGRDFAVIDPIGRLEAQAASQLAASKGAKAVPARRSKLSVKAKPSRGDQEECDIYSFPSKSVLDAYLSQIDRHPNPDTRHPTQHEAEEHLAHVAHVASKDQEPSKPVKAAAIHQVDMFEHGREVERRKKEQLRNGRPPLPPIKHSAESDSRATAFVDAPIVKPLQARKPLLAPTSLQQALQQPAPPQQQPHISRKEVELPVQPPSAHPPAPQPHHITPPKPKRSGSVHIPSDTYDDSAFENHGQSLLERSDVLDVSWGQRMQGRKMSAQDHGARGFSSIYHNHQVALMPNFDLEMPASLRTLEVTRPLNDKARSAPSLAEVVVQHRTGQQQRPQPSPGSSQRTRARTGSLSSMVRHIEERREQHRSLPPPMALVQAASLATERSEIARSDTRMLTKSGLFSLDGVMAGKR